MPIPSGRKHVQRCQQVSQLLRGGNHVTWHLAKCWHLSLRRDATDWQENTDVRTGSNGYKNVLDFIITLVVVNSHKFFSYTDWYLVILSTNRIDCLYYRLNIDNSFPSELLGNRTDTRQQLSRPYPDRDPEKYSATPCNSTLTKLLRYSVLECPLF